MSDLNILDRMFHPDTKVKIEEHYKGKKKVVLQEQQELDSKIELLHIPNDAIIINLDGSFACDRLFAGSQGECKRADYLIISELEKRILFIEMKKSTSQKKDIIKQLKGSLCVFKYLQTIAREFFQEENFLITYKQRFISINHTGMKRTRKTKIEKSVPVHDTPESLLKLSWALVPSNSTNCQHKHSRLGRGTAYLLDDEVF